MKRYNPKEIEAKWQKAWEEQGVYNVDFTSAKPKFVGFGMFNYPSGAGIHVGHVRNFTIPDVITRVKRQQGFESYQPVGWDSFGLPAENFAIKTGVPPQESTIKAIEKYHDQYRAMGWAVDWTKEINTTDPEYYKWTQWCFSKLFEHGLAYQKESAQWWCDHDKTVLADEQVEAGKCWRCGNPVIKKNLKQWFFKITEYADEILEATDDLDWTPSVKASQKAWIGRSVGAEIEFRVQSSEFKIEVFTTRPDTLFGSTFMVLAPEHPLVAKITTDQQKKAVEDYVAQTLKKTEVQRQQDADKDKSGVFTGAYAINPVNEEKIPIWIADYVLIGYGTGAIMAVPAHDERDFEFAKKFDLPIKPVVLAEFIDTISPTREGAKMVERVVAQTIVKHPTEDKYLLARRISWENKTYSLPMGGIDNDETPAEAAKRELVEETGYQNTEGLESFGQPYIAEFYHEFKKTNRRATVHTFVTKLKDLKQVEISEEEQGINEVDWFTAAEVMNLVHGEGAQSTFKAYIEGADLLRNGEGIMYNSGKYDGLRTSEVREKIVTDLAGNGAAEEKVNYKMRDWLISRQRYWGAPIPIIHCPKDGAVAVPEADLPVELPVIENYQPTGGNVSVLAGVDDWVNTTCPKCGGPARRETDTMDGYVCSSWYFLRYLDPKNNQQPWNPDLASKWMPIDFYNGADHATAHLLYARFFTRFFHKLGLVDTPEPFKKMVYNGKIKAHDGSAFSKSKGNGIDPLEVIEQGYGADAIRLYEMFAAPVELDVLWDEQGIPGSYRFLNRIWVLTLTFLAAPKGDTPSEAAGNLKRITHKTIKKVTQDMEDGHFNTAIAAMMEAVNGFYKVKEAHGMQQSDDWRFAIESTLQLVAPFAPHLSEELWSQLGHKDTIHVDHWPTWDEALLKSDNMIIVVQVNGKLRGEVEVAHDATQEQIVAAAKANEKVATFLKDTVVKKEIYVATKLINFVI